MKYEKDNKKMSETKKGSFNEINVHLIVPKDNPFSKTLIEKYQFLLN